MTLAESRTPFLALFGRAGHDRGGAAIACLAPSCAVAMWELGAPPAAGRALADVLPPGIVREASRYRSEGRPWWLILDSSVSEDCRDAPWESLTTGGETLAATALVIRDAIRTEGSPEDRGGRRRSGLLNLFPIQEYDFAGRLEGHVADERLTHCYARFAREGLDRFDELIVVAHGDERGLLSSSGEHFEIETNALPPRVWLLACNVDGGMYKLARTLLARGVKSVVAATGDLSAPQMADIVDEWLSAESAHEPADWILTRRPGDTRSGGMRALTVFGEIRLEGADSSEWNRRTWSSFAQGNNPTIERNPAELERAIRVLESPGDALWPVTRHWLLAGALRQAENFDHTSMNRLLPRVEACARDANTHCAIAVAHYRRGEYHRAARHIVAGLADAEGESEIPLELLALLTNVLIDMNLPQAAEAALRAERELELRDAALDRMYRFQWLDRSSRNAFRAGRIAEAREAMEAKRREALARAADTATSGATPALDDSRELAWLLYYRSWEDLKTGRSSAAGNKLAREATSLIRAMNPAEPAKGNDPVGYLLRSLACRMWTAQKISVARDQDEVIEALRPWLEVIVDRCSEHDPGPWAFARCFLALAGELPPEDVELSIRALERSGYLLEAAGFAGLAGHEDVRRSLSDEFSKRRAIVIAELRGLRATLPAVVDRLSDAGPEPVPM